LKGNHNSLYKVIINLVIGYYINLKGNHNKLRYFI